MIAARPSSGTLAQRSSGSRGLAVMTSVVIDRGPEREARLAVNGFQIAE
jgi:hypothetical protein